MLLKKNSSSNDIALGGILVSINIVILSLVSIMPTLKAMLLFVTSLITVISILKSNTKTSLVVYFATTILALLIVIDKRYVIYYFIFFGLYPIVKYYLEKKNNIWIEYFLKFIYFNISSVIIYSLIKNLFGFEINAPISKIGIIAILQIIYLLFDYMLSRVITILLKYPIWKNKNKAN